MPARRLAEIPTASMADVAFLLLLFFLVATAIRTETGLPLTLPDPVSHTTVALPRALAVTVDAAGALRLDGAAATEQEVRAAIAGSAGVPLVRLGAHRATPYAAYVDALDAVLLGFRDADATPRIALREPVAG